MKQTNELPVQPNEYGLDAKQANDLIGNLPVIKSEREILISQFNEVILLDIEDVNTSKKARELRLKIQKNRTQGINKWHKEAKDMFLRGGQFVDAIKRFESSVNETMESRLEEIEKYAEIKEQKRIAELKEKRIKELELYSDFVPFGIDLGILSDDEFTKLFNGAKLQYEAKLEAELKAKKDAEEKAERERLLAEEKARIEEINSILSKLNNVRVVGNNVLLSNDVVFCTVKELTLKSIEDFNYQQNALLGGQEAFENWVNSFVAPTEINDLRTKEVLKKFEAFKKWALTLK